MNAKLILEDNSEFEGESFGAPKSTSGEVVFSTGMVGYPQSMTDPSYLGQILIFTYPLIGNYGVPNSKYFESNRIQTTGIIVSNYIDTPSHFQSKITLGAWLKKEGVPGLEIKDTRLLTQKIREKGAMLGKIIINKQDVAWYDPNVENLVAKVSVKKSIEHKGDKAGKWYGKKVVLVDCGLKKNIQRCLVKRGVTIFTVPWDFDPFENTPHLRGVHSATSEVLRSDSSEENFFDAIIISPGPGDPKMADKTIEITQKALQKDIPILGVCLGHQLLALAAGGNTAKLKFGHRSQNQPCIQEGTKRCFITTQNHGFHVSKIPQDFKPWFTNANDGSNEGLIHKNKPVMSVQFHPEACPGPTDTEWIFDYFLAKIP